MSDDVTLATTTDDLEAAREALAADGAAVGKQSDDAPAPEPENEPLGNDVISVASTTDDQSQVEQAASGDEPQQRPQHRKGNLQKRIDKITGRNHALERELDVERARRGALEGRIAELERGTGRPQNGNGHEQRPSEGQPRPADYRTYEDYEAAVKSWSARQSAGAQRAQEARAGEATRARADAFADHGRSTHLDWDRALEQADAHPDGGHVPEQALREIARLPNGPEVAYFLAQSPQARAELRANPGAAAQTVRHLSANLANGGAAHGHILALQRVVNELGNGEAVLKWLETHPDEGRRIVGQPLPRAAVHLSQLSARLGSGRRPVTTAPAPITPVGGTSRGSTVPLDEMDYQSYRRARDGGRNS